MSATPTVTWALLENEDYDNRPFWADDEEEDD